jgi:putative transposase
LILCPLDKRGMAQALGAAHRRWANFVNARGRWRGHLFDGRYASVVMDEVHLMSALRYVALSPVRAGLAVRPEEWEWSSVRAHLAGQDDGLVTVKPVLDRVSSFAGLIANQTDDASFAALKAAELTGRPVGSADFVEALERLLERPVARRAPGRKPSRPRFEDAARPFEYEMRV